jgi:hypothetical protein
MIAAKDQPLWATNTVHTLDQLGAVDELGRLVFERADLPEHAMEKALRNLASGEAPANAKALVRISEAALVGKWDAAKNARMQLVDGMVRYCGLGGRVPKPRSDEHVLAVRSELAKWVDQPEGSNAIRGLASSPRLEERAIYVGGLKSTHPRDAADCIRALGAIKASDAVTALVDVLDREDALEDLYAATRNGVLSATIPPPIHQASLAYMADRVLTEITGGKIEDVPNYTGPEVLKNRREHWRRWLKAHPAATDAPAK